VGLKVESLPLVATGLGGNPCRGGVMYNGQCYDFNSKKVTWERARMYCSRDALGDLPIIRKRPVYDAILKYAKEKNIK
jgi:hypothetical protein